MFTLDGITSSKREYIEWLIESCSRKDTGIDSVITAEAIDLLAERLLTPLQFEYHLTIAFEEAFKVGVKPVTVDIIESIIAKDINELEPQLTRQGYNVRTLAETLNMKPSVVQSFLKGNLSSVRAQEIQNEMLAVGIPI